MATTLLGAKIESRVIWREDIKSRKQAFASLAKYKKEVLGIKTQLMGLGNIKIKVDGLAKAKSQLSQIKTQAAKTVKAPVTKTTKVSATSDFMGPPKPETLGFTQARQKSKALEETKAQIAAEKRLDKIYAFERRPMMQKLKKEMGELGKEQFDNYITSLKQIKSTRKLKLAMVDITKEVRELNRYERDRLKIMNKQNFATQRATASMAQLAGGAFSVFTMMQGIGAVARTGMDFQKVESGMVAVSTNASEASENITFVRGEARRLGADLIQTSKGFTQLLAAGQGKIALEDMKALTTGVLETSTVLGLSTDDTAGSIRALTQMMSKGKVMSKLSWTFSW